jgi:hypothetical protein
MTVHGYPFSYTFPVALTRPYLAFTYTRETTGWWEETENHTYNNLTLPKHIKEYENHSEMVANCASSALRTGA